MDTHNNSHLFYYTKKFEKLKLNIAYFLARIFAAKNMLDDSMIPVTGVSEKYGLSSVSCFCRIFKQETNQAPLRCRKEIYKQAE